MRYGFRFLRPYYWSLPVNKSTTFTLPESGLRPEISDLIAHLQQTGTGVAKLKLLVEVAKATQNDSDEFLAAAKLSLPEVTWGKVEKYVESKREEQRKEMEAKAKEARDKEDARKAKENVLESKGSTNTSEPSEPQGNTSGETGEATETPTESTQLESIQQGKSKKSR